MRRIVALFLITAACAGGEDSTATPETSAGSPGETTTAVVATTDPPATTSQPPPSSPATTTSTTDEPAVWERLDRMSYPRSELPAVALDGRLFAPGGFMETATGVVGQSVVEVYDPAVDAWSLATELPEARHHHMAASHGGWLYVFGGFARRGGSTTIETTTWRYHPGTDTWETLAPMPTAVASGGAAVVGDVIYLVGGVPDGTGVLRFDTSSGVWQDGPSLTVAREHNAALVLGDSLYALGGRWDGANLDSVEILDARADGWVPGPALFEARSGFGAAVWKDALAVGGGEDLQGSGTLSSVEVLDGSSWRLIEPLAVPLHGFSLVTLDEVLYAVGGSRRAGEISNSGDLYGRLP